MGNDIADSYPVARETFQQADDILGFSLSTLCFEGTEDVLTDTINTQPALYVCGVAILRALQSQLPDAIPAYVAGHSLGEFTALTAAGALSFEEGVRLVRERGRLMREAGNISPGAMAALLGLDTETVHAICTRAREQTDGVLVLANDNCPGQIVISGDDETLDVGLALATEAGARRAVKLAVSIAAHSPLMESVAISFRETLAQTAFSEAQVPVYANVTAEPITSAEAIREELGAQLTGSVRWTESMQAMINAGAERFVEIGPKDVLSGLLRRIDRDRERVSLNSTASLQQFIEGVAAG